MHLKNKFTVISYLIVIFLISGIVSAKVASPMEDVNHVTDNTLDSLNKAATARPVPGSTRVGTNPVLFLVGNSTMRTGTLGNGDNGQWGWGYYMPDLFDKSKITVENHALGGMSSRTFYTKLWKDVLKGVRKGDWVIIELGHNDNGPYDRGRARASIPGTGKDSLNVVIEETGEKETVYTYGEYMRRFINDVKKKGAYPILMSLTPRCAWSDSDSTKIVRVDSTFGLWAREIANEENVPFADLNNITASKYEKFGKDKVKTMFYLDRIHTSEFGAKINAESAVEALKSLIEVPLKDWLLPEVPDTVTGRSRKDKCPVVFTIGDSTVKNEDSGDDSMWGWGSLLHEMFDTTRISVENHAMAGRSARTFLDEGRWDKVYKALRPGDFVIMQFGHNDGGDINTGKARGELHGSGPESKVFKMEATGKNKVVYTYGWYLRKFIMDAREKGAIPIIVSHTPRNKWKDGKIESNAADFGKWAREVAIQTNTCFIDLNGITGKKLQAIGEAGASRYFKNDHTHSSKDGARLNATGVTEGLRNADCELKHYLKKQSYSFNLSDMPAYNDFNGYGYEFNTRLNSRVKKPVYFSVRVPDGNYKVTLTLGDKKRKGNTTVRVENRRLMLNNVSTRKWEIADYSFNVHKRSRAINIKDSVRINSREEDSFAWDDKLTFEFNGESPAVKNIHIEPVDSADSVTAIYLCGDSTVVDQFNEPWTSWGQIIPAYFDSNVVIANHAESGESLSSFISSNRLEKVLSMAKPGDWMIIEFGHNDQKEKLAGAGAWYNFATNLKTFIDKARMAGVNPLLITPTARRFFDNEGHILYTHGDYPEAMRMVAERENVPLIDLNPMTMTLYESLGIEDSKKAFVHYPAGSFPGQTEDLADNTHFNAYGATQIAKCILQGICDNNLPLKKYISSDFIEYNPQNPDIPDDFIWPRAAFYDNMKPYGN